MMNRAMARAPITKQDIDRIGELLGLRSNETLVACVERFVTAFNLNAYVATRAKGRNDEMIAAWDRLGGSIRWTSRVGKAYCWKSQAEAIEELDRNFGTWRARIGVRVVPIRSMIGGPARLPEGDGR